jgi:hypothetical protein
VTRPLAGESCEPALPCRSYGSTVIDARVIAVISVGFFDLPRAGRARTSQAYHRFMVVDITTSIEINCPRPVVAEFVSNPDNATRWYLNIRSISWETPPPAVVGSRIAFVAQFLGRRIAYTYQVREIVPDERFVMSTAQGPFPMQTTYSWQDAESGGTFMTLRNAGEPSGFGKMAARMMVAAMRRANQKDLERLKAILEDQQLSRTLG